MLLLYIGLDRGSHTPELLLKCVQYTLVHEQYKGTLQLNTNERNLHAASGVVTHHTRSPRSTLKLRATGCIRRAYYFKVVVNFVVTIIFLLW